MHLCAHRPKSTKVPQPCEFRPEKFNSALRRRSAWLLRVTPNNFTNRFYRKIYRIVTHLSPLTSGGTEFPSQISTRSTSRIWIRTSSPSRAREHSPKNRKNILVCRASATLRDKFTFNLSHSHPSNTVTLSLLLISTSILPL